MKIKEEMTKIPTKLICDICNKVIWGQHLSHAEYLLSQHKLSKLCKEIGDNIIGRKRK